MRVTFPDGTGRRGATEAAVQRITEWPGRPRERGFALVFYGVMLTFVVACVGLAIDVGSILMIRSRLVAAVDAAALGAGRSINGASTPTAAKAAANAAALQFFAANFPTGYFNALGAPTVTPDPEVQTDGNGNPNGTLQITVTASVPAPTYFMNIFGVHSVTVGATGTATRRSLVLMLVLDQSSSMGSAGTAGSPCAVMISAAKNFINDFSPYDYVGLITFDSTANLIDSPTTSRTQITTDIGNIQCGNNTNTISALELAYQQIQATNLPLALNTVVLFTDGSPNGITAAFPVRTTLDTRWGPSLCPPGSGCSPAGPAPAAQSGYTKTAPNVYQTPSGYISNACGGTTADGNTDVNGTYSNNPCVNMPLVCTNPGDTFYGTITQWGGQNSYGAATWGIANPTSGSTSGTAPDNLSLPPSSHCNLGSAVVGSAGTNIRQYIAYIPDTDAYGNSLLGVVATSHTGTAAGGYVSRTGQWNAINLGSQNDWLFQVNNVCSPDPITPACRNTGDVWSSYSSTGTASNFFPKGTAYAGHLRPDQPNTIVAASMNGAMAEANKIRSDTTYNIMIDTMYLTGNATDSVDREFLPIIANTPQITRLPYDPHNFTPYANPAYHSNQQIGTYAVTADKNELASIMNQIASQVLRLSH